jgi:hypothetical protein
VCSFIEEHSSASYEFVCPSSILVVDLRAVCRLLQWFCCKCLTDVLKNHNKQHLLGIHMMLKVAVAQCHIHHDLRPEYAANASLADGAELAMTPSLQTVYPPDPQLEHECSQLRSEHQNPKGGQLSTVGLLPLPAKT